MMRDDLNTEQARLQRVLIGKGEQDRANQNYAVISVPQYVYDQFADPAHATITIGQQQLAMAVQNHAADQSIQLSTKLLRKTGLRAGVHVKYVVSGNTLHLGPLIAVLVDAAFYPKIRSTHQSGSRLAVFLEAVKRSGGIIFFCTAQQVMLRERKVKGLYFDEYKQSWQNQIFPLPDFLYDRTDGLTLHNARFRQLRQRMKQLNVISLSACHSLDKWDVHQQLFANVQLRTYLPETELFQHKHDLSMLEKKGQVYLKKCMSSNGRQVMRLHKINPTAYEYSYNHHRPLHGRVNTKQELQAVIKRFFKNDRVIVQEAIRLPHIEKCIVDLRATVQRDGSGELKVMSVVVRIGDPGSPVTSTRTGSSCVALARFIERNSHVRRHRALLQALADEQRMNTFLHSIYNGLENAYGSFCELGIDLAVDVDGHLWFIEANARPAKTAMFYACDHPTVLKAFQNPLSYANYLFWRNKSSLFVG